jgi:hypothetical protein
MKITCTRSLMKNHYVMRICSVRRQEVQIPLCRFSWYNVIIATISTMFTLFHFSFINNLNKGKRKFVLYLTNMYNFCTNLINLLIQYIYRSVKQSQRTTYLIKITPHIIIRSELVDNVFFSKSNGFMVIDVNFMLFAYK